MRARTGPESWPRHPRDGTGARLQLYESSVSQARTSHQVNQMVKCAYEARVSHLFIAHGASKIGSFNETTQRVHQHSSPKNGDEDLLNAAACQTIKNEGEVFILPPELPQQFRNRRSRAVLANSRAASSAAPAVDFSAATVKILLICSKPRIKTRATQQEYGRFA